MNGRSIAIFGATGSIGKATLKVLSQYRKPFHLTLVSGHQNVCEMLMIARTYAPEHICMTDKKSAIALKEALHQELPHIEISGGDDALLRLAEKPYDWVMMAISGLFASLPIAFRLVQYSSVVALANKESIVVAGELLMATARQHHTTILPVDSEHNAIFQALHRSHDDEIKGITLTASGGACRDVELEHLNTVDAAFVLRHPVWQMGEKITIDSATMVNKGLEVMEAAILFSLLEDQIQVLIHRDSILHGAVHYIDGTSITIMSKPDMQTAIAHTLAYPHRMQLSLSSHDFTMKPLVFTHPDPKRYPALHLAREAFRHSISMRIVYLVASECATKAFLEHHIRFQDITDVIKKMMKLHSSHQHDDTDNYGKVDTTEDILIRLNFAKFVRHTTEELLNNHESLPHHG